MKYKDDDRNKEEREMRGMPILVIKDTKTGYISANVVPRKGECNFATKCVVDFLEYLGYKKVMLKCDQEDSIMTVKKAAQREWQGDTSPEESPAYDSQSNGSVENANQQIQ